MLSVGLKTILGNDFVQNSQRLLEYLEISNTPDKLYGVKHIEVKTTMRKSHSIMVKDQNTSLRIIMKPIIDIDTYNKVQELISVRKMIIQQ